MLAKPVLPVTRGRCKEDGARKVSDPQQEADTLAAPTSKRRAAGILAHRFRETPPRRRLLSFLSTVLSQASGLAVYEVADAHRLVAESLGVDEPRVDAQRLDDEELLVALHHWRSQMSSSIAQSQFAPRQALPHSPWRHGGCPL